MQCLQRKTSEERVKLLNKPHKLYLQYTNQYGEINSGGEKAQLTPEAFVCQQENS